MNATLALFLEQYSAFGGWTEKWNGVPLAFRTYLADTLPPQEFIGSVRAIIIRDNEVLVVHSDVPILSVGGRCEPNETLEQGLMREIAEETGCLVKLIAVIGFIHAQHTDEQRPAWGRPAPDFIDPMFVVRFQGFDPSLKNPNELQTEFISILQIEAAGIHQIDQTFLNEALRAQIPQLKNHLGLENQFVFNQVIKLREMGFKNLPLAKLNLEKLADFDQNLEIDDTKLVEVELTQKAAELDQKIIKTGKALGSKKHAWIEADAIKELVKKGKKDGMVNRTDTADAFGRALRELGLSLDETDGFDDLLDYLQAESIFIEDDENDFDDIDTDLNPKLDNDFSLELTNIKPTEVDFQTELSMDDYLTTNLNLELDDDVSLGLELSEDFETEIAIDDFADIEEKIKQPLSTRQNSKHESVFVFLK